VSEQIWYRNDDLDTVVKQPKDARAQLAQGGWFPLSDEAVAAHEKEAADAVAADEKAMREQAEQSMAARDAAAAEAAKAAEAELEPETADAEPDTPEAEPPARKRRSTEKESE
jgi:hypothetical protein